MQQFHVISVWLQHPYAGLGDLIRGTMHLCELSQKHNFKLTVDTQFHPVSKYLMESAHETREYVLQNKDKILHYINSENGDRNQLLEVIQTAMRNGRTEPMLIFTNLAEHLNVIPSTRSKEFIRSILTPTPEFWAGFNQMCAQFKIKQNYSIFHIRMGDDELVNHRIHVDQYKTMLGVIDRMSEELDPSTYIISDSYGFKHFLYQARPHLANQIIRTNPIHLSHSTDAKSDAEKVHDTLFDFFLMINAKAIKTYTNYTWVSGFVQWASHAFNRPLININHKIYQSTQRIQYGQTAQHVLATLQNMRVPSLQKARPLQNMRVPSLQNMRVPSLQNARPLQKAQPLQNMRVSAVQNLRVPSLQKARPLQKAQPLQNMRVPASRFAFSLNSKPTRRSIFISAPHPQT